MGSDEVGILCTNETASNIVRQAPPPQSRPEASNFPIQQYEMSADLKLWKPPPSYPEPPKGMFFEIPKEQPQTRAKPKKIFPWEDNQVPATRVFPEDVSPSLEVDSQAQVELHASSMNAENGSSAINAPPTIHVSDHHPLATYVRTNAWDDIPAIDRHVRSLGIFTFHNRERRTSHESESRSSDAGSSQEQQANRRPSLRITDFPTADERPSLPVTPNPVRRSTFWGTDQDHKGLPAVDDVPSQSAWDPHAKLDELVRRHSMIVEEGLGEVKDLPQRQIPESFKPTIAMATSPQGSMVSFSSRSEVSNSSSQLSNVELARSKG